uniref:helix-turn-helix domain-containing protein n=1 Tax=Hydrogenophaga borbori TaxID=2294117 RepID=UPI00301BBFFC
PETADRLRNRIERAMALSEGPVLGAADLFPERALDEPGPAATLADARERAELAQIERALEQSGGRRAEAAASLGVSRTTLWKRRKKLRGGEGEGGAA